MFEIKIGLGLAQDKNFISNLCKEIKNLRKGLLFEYSYLIPKIRIRDNTSLLDYNEFAMAFCPHHYHKITIQVVDKYRKSVPDATVKCISADAAQGGESTAKADKDGYVVLYLNSGIRQFRVEKEGMSEQETLSITNGSRKQNSQASRMKPAVCGQTRCAISSMTITRRCTEQLRHLIQGSFLIFLFTHWSTDSP